jgi:hypothetical protein
MINRILLLAALFAAPIFSIAQDPSECGLDDNPVLTDVESEFLKIYFGQEDNENLESGTKILFLTGTNGATLGSKSEYFDAIEERFETGIAISHGIIALTEEEKTLSGHDAIITYWVKVITEGQKRKMLREAGGHE